MTDLETRTYDPLAVQQIREDWIAKKMLSRQEEFTEFVPIKIVCGTWNVNGKTSDEALEKWLFPNGERDVDLYAVGFQEIVDLTAVNVAVDTKGVQRSIFWAARIEQTLNSPFISNGSNNYVRVATRHMVGILLVIFVRRALEEGRHVSRNIKVATAAVGALGVMGNKGSVSCSMQLFDSTICFVSSHLAANRENVEARNNDYANIMSKTTFYAPASQQSSDSPKLTSEEVGLDPLDAMYAYDSRVTPVADISSNIRHAQPGPQDDDDEGPRDGRTLTRIELALQQQQQQQSGEEKSIVTAGGTKIEGHDFIIWFGDLNYRIDETLSTAEVFDRVAKNDLSSLRARDQLNVEHAKGNVFMQFNEGVLHFPPTYKYQPGTDLYEQRPDKKLRAPAWCDRVLYYSKGMTRLELAAAGMSITSEEASLAEDRQHDDIALITYCRSNEPNCSDHKPVVALFECKLRSIIVSKQKELQRELVRVLDKWENNSIPRLDLNCSSVTFEAVSYKPQKDACKYLSVSNTGSVIAHYRFVPKFSGGNYDAGDKNEGYRRSSLATHSNQFCKNWLSVVPTYGMLIPGEMCQIRLSAKLVETDVHLLNLGLDTLEDILVLRLENGRDFYITVQGTFERSCFGCTLEQLAASNLPMRSIPLEQDKALRKMKNALRGGSGAAVNEEGEEEDDEQALSIPKELWRIADCLYRTEGMLQERDLFLLPGKPGEVTQIRECLDRGLAFPTVCAASMAEVFLEFLMSLVFPVIPESLLPSIELNDQNLRQWTRRFLEHLPPLNYNVFVYVVSFFREVLASQDFNRLTPEKISSICSACLSRFSSEPLILQAYDAQNKNNAGANNGNDIMASAGLQAFGQIFPPVAHLTTEYQRLQASQSIRAVLLYILTASSI